MGTTAPEEDAEGLQHGQSQGPTIKSCFKGTLSCPSSNFIEGWSEDSVKYPPGLGVLTPWNASVLNCSNQNMAGHWESWSLKTNQRSRQDIEILRTCSSFPVSPRKQQSQLCSTQSTHTGGVRTGRHFLLPMELSGFH